MSGSSSHPVVLYGVVSRSRVGATAPSTLSAVSGPCRRVTGANASTGPRRSTIRPAVPMETPDSGAILSLVLDALTWLSTLGVDLAERSLGHRIGCRVLAVEG